MHAFRRKLSPKEIHNKGPKTKPRGKPGTTPDDKANMKLMPIFKIALEKEIPHLHHGEVPSITDPVEIQKLQAGTEALDAIYDWIEGQTAELLDKVNHSLLAYNKGTEAEKANLEKDYNDAVREFKKFVNSLNDETKSASLDEPNFAFGPTINAANIEPIPDGDGFYTSVRIVVQWQGGTHSDSSVTHVP